MKNKIGLHYFLSKKAQRRSYFLNGLGSCSLIVFAFSLGAFFRPYYEHKDSYLPSEEATFVYSAESNGGLNGDELLSFFNSYEGKDLDRVERNADKTIRSCLAQIEGERNVYVLVGPEGFDLTCLGFYPASSSHIPEQGEALILYQSSVALKNIEETNFCKSLSCSQSKVRNIYLKKNSDVEFPFSPLKKADAIFALSENNLPKEVTYKPFSVYLSYHLKGQMSDRDILYYAAKSGYIDGVISKSMTSFIYPGLAYARFYPPMRAVYVLLLALAIIVSITILISLLVKDFVRSKDDKSECETLKIIGFKRRDFLVSSLASSSLPLFSSAITIVGISHVFMAIFKSIAGFSFFYSWPCYLCLLFLIVLSILVKSVQGLSNYKAK